MTPLDHCASWRSCCTLAYSCMAQILASQCTKVADRQTFPEAASGSRVHPIVAPEFEVLEHTFPLVRVQEEHLAVMALEVTSGPGGVSRVEPQRLASWRHPGPVTALQVRAPAQSGRWQLARLSKKCTIESSSETSSAGGSTEIASFNGSCAGEAPSARHALSTHSTVSLQSLQ